MPKRFLVTAFEECKLNRFTFCLVVYKFATAYWSIIIIFRILELVNNPRPPYNILIIMFYCIILLGEITLGETPIKRLTYRIQNVSKQIILVFYNEHHIV